MDFRSMIDQVKSAFVIGKGNTYLHGGVPGRREVQGQYEEQQNPASPQNVQAYQSPYQQPANGYQAAQQGYQQQAYQQGYPQEAYRQPDGFAQMQGQAYAAHQQQNYQQRQAYPPYAAPAQQGYAQTQQPPGQQADTRPAESFETQMDPFAQETSRNRRSRQHQEARQPETAYSQQVQHENIVQFPNAAPQPTKEAATGGIDAYVINVFNINSCRQAMSCLRRGQCTLIVMDQLVDKAEIRRFVDMLTGACYALSGTMTRLSSKIGFYIMAPAGMTVYTDPTTSNANAPVPRPPQAPLYQAPFASPNAQAGRAAADFSQQNAYPQAPQMNFSAPKPQAQPRQEAYSQPYTQEYQPVLQPEAPDYSQYADNKQRRAQ